MHNNSLAPHSPWEQHPLRALLPLLLVGVVIGFTGLFTSGEALGDDVVRRYVQHRRLLEQKVTSNSAVLIVSSWAASALLVMVAFVVTIAVCLAVPLFVRAPKEDSRKNRLPLLLMLLSALIALAITCITRELPLFLRPVNQLFPYFKSITRIRVTYLMDFLAFWESILLVCAFFFLATPLHEVDKKQQIVSRWRLANVLLYLSGFTLAVGVLEFDFLYQIVMTDNLDLAVHPTQKLILGKGLSLFAGTSASLFIAALYVPTLLLLQADANHYFPAEDRGAGGEAISASPLVTTTAWSKAGKLFAILSPVIAGWLGESVVSALGSLISG